MCKKAAIVAWKSALTITLLVGAGALWLLAGSVPSMAQGGAPYPDVPKDHWAKPAIGDLVKKGILTDQKGAKYDGSKFVTRYEAAVLIDKMVQYMESAHKPLKTTQLAPGKMPAIAASPAHAALTRLVKYKFIAADSVLLKAPGTAPVTANELSLTLSTVMSRLEDRGTKPTPEVDDED